MTRLQISGAAVTDTGKKRSHNEDAIFADDVRRIWAVADGLGGHSAGDVASAMVVEAVARCHPAGLAADTMDQLEELLDEVSTQLRRLAQEREVDLIASTVVLAFALDQYLFCGWVGDSRLYLLRDSRLSQITVDHNELEDARRGGRRMSDDQLAELELNPAITRAIGDASEQSVLFDWCVIPLLAGQRFFLCSDGINKELTDEALADLLRAGGTALAAAQTIKQTMLESMARDNFSFIVLDVA